MKLQDKRTVSAEVATQKKRQIDEGMNLAKKVDALRETKLNEEKRLEDFRRESVARVQIQIDDKLKELDSIQTSIRVAQINLSELRKPLDSEWQRVNVMANAVEEQKALLYQKHGEVDKGIALNTQKERELSQERQRIDEERRRATADLIQAEELKREGKKVFMEARTKAEGIVNSAIEREEAVVVREKEVSLRENENLVEKKRLALIAKQQKDKDREIADKYQTLQRTLGRMK